MLAQSMVTASHVDEQAESTLISMEQSERTIYCHFRINLPEVELVVTHFG